MLSVSTDLLFGDTKCSCCVQKCTLGEAAVRLCGMNTMLDTKGAQQKEKCQSPPDSEPIIVRERRQRSECSCLFVCVNGRGREKNTEKCIKRMHLFTVMISSRYQQPELVANQTECSAVNRLAGSWPITVSFTQKQTLTLHSLISFPTLSVTPFIDWLLCSQLEPLFDQSHHLYFYCCLSLLFFLLSTASSSSCFCAHVCKCGVPVVTGNVCARTYVHERACMCL